jgi:DME family drug/metabolite transporter
MMRARAEILFAAVLFGTTGTAQALADVGAPVAVGAARIAVGGCLLVLVALAAGALRGLGGAWRAVLLAGAGVAVYQLAFFAAVDVTGVAVGTIVAIGSAPVTTGLLEWAVEGTRPGRRWLLATALATAGIALLTLASADDASVSGAGIALALAAGAGYAGYAVVAKRLLRLGHAPVGIMGAAFGTGALLLLPALALADTGELVSARGAALALYLGVLPTAVAYIAYARGLRHVSAAESTTLVLAEPLTATALGALVLDERVGFAAGAGAALVLAGLIALAAGRPGRRAELPAEVVVET